jgi:uncharacterized protein YndB with AHSA1/START domain
METKEKTIITVQTTVNAPVEEVWELWNNPRDVEKWNNASDDWHTPHAENDLRVGGVSVAGWKQKTEVRGSTLPESTT